MCINNKTHCRHFTFNADWVHQWDHFTMIKPIPSNWWSSLRTMSMLQVQFQDSWSSSFVTVKEEIYLTLQLLQCSVYWCNNCCIMYFSFLKWIFYIIQIHHFVNVIYYLLDKITSSTNLSFKLNIFDNLIYVFSASKSHSSPRQARLFLFSLWKDGDHCLYFL